MKKYLIMCLVLLSFGVFSLSQVSALPNNEPTSILNRDEDRALNVTWLDEEGNPIRIGAVDITKNPVE
jgi:hypothetical protein